MFLPVLHQGPQQGTKQFLSQMIWPFGDGLKLASKGTPLSAPKSHSSPGSTMPSPQQNAVSASPPSTDAFGGAFGG